MTPHLIAENQSMVIMRHMRCYQHYAQHHHRDITHDDALLSTCKRRCEDDTQCDWFTVEISEKNCFLYRGGESVCNGGNRKARNFVSGFKGLIDDIMMDDRLARWVCSLSYLIDLLLVKDDIVMMMMMMMN